MSDRTSHNSQPEGDAPEGRHSAHPLDSWLKRELRTLYGDAERDQLPPGLADLAERLEEKIRRSADGRAKQGASTDDPGRDPISSDRTTSGRHGKR